VYEYIRGVVASRDEGAVALDVGGIGFRLAVSASTLRRLPAGGEATLFTHLLVREERHELYGFADISERHLFRQLLQVSGVGPAVALGLLSAYEPEALAAHIARGEIALLMRVKGIGKRTAERILVELRDRFVKAGGATAASLPAGGAHADAVLALCSLGMPRVEAERRVGSVKQADQPVEELVRQALRGSI
jgi:Holliday junction DNA helicase RuvA